MENKFEGLDKVLLGYWIINLGVSFDILLSFKWNRKLTPFETNAALIRVVFENHRTVLSHDFQNYSKPIRVNFSFST